MAKFQGIFLLSLLLLATIQVADAESLEDIKNREAKCVENAGTDKAELAKCTNAAARCVQLVTAIGAAKAEREQALCNNQYQVCSKAANRDDALVTPAMCTRAHNECFTATADYTVGGEAAKCFKTGKECAKAAKWNPSKLAKCAKKGKECVEATAAGGCTIEAARCVRAAPHDARMVAQCTQTAHEETAAFQAKVAEIAKTVNECNAAAADDEEKKMTCAEEADKARAALAAAGTCWDMLGKCWDMKTLILVGGGGLLAVGVISFMCWCCCRKCCEDEA